MALQLGGATKTGQVEEAAFELQSHGLVDIQRALGKHWWLYLEQNFYELIDHQVMDWESSTQEDAKTLARLLLEDEARQRIATLHAATPWEKRRFNPALRVLLSLIPKGRMSGEIQADRRRRFCYFPKIAPDLSGSLPTFVSAAPSRSVTRPNARPLFVVVTITVTVLDCTKLATLAGRSPHPLALQSGQLWNNYSHLSLEATLLAHSRKRHSVTRRVGFRSKCGRFYNVLNADQNGHYCLG